MTRCDSANMLRNAAKYIDLKKAYAYAYTLEQMADNIGQVRRGEVTLDEFARFYMIEKQENE